MAEGRGRVEGAGGGPAGEAGVLRGAFDQPDRHASTQARRGHVGQLVPEDVDVPGRVPLQQVRRQHHAHRAPRCARAERRHLGDEGGPVAVAAVPGGRPAVPRPDEGGGGRRVGDHPAVPGALGPDLPDVADEGLESRRQPAQLGRGTALPDDQDVRRRGRVQLREEPGLEPLRGVCVVCRPVLDDAPGAVGPADDESQRHPHRDVVPARQPVRRHRRQRKRVGSGTARRRPAVRAVGRQRERGQRQGVQAREHVGQVVPDARMSRGGERGERVLAPAGHRAGHSGQEGPRHLGGRAARRLPERTAAAGARAAPDARVVSPVLARIAGATASTANRAATSATARVAAPARPRRRRGARPAGTPGGGHGGTRGAPGGTGGTAARGRGGRVGGGPDAGQGPGKAAPYGRTGEAGWSGPGCHRWAAGRDHGAGSWPVGARPAWSSCSLRWSLPRDGGGPARPVCPEDRPAGGLSVSRVPARLPATSPAPSALEPHLLQPGVQARDDLDDLPGDLLSGEPDALEHLRRGGRGRGTAGARRSRAAASDTASSAQRCWTAVPTPPARPLSSTTTTSRCRAASGTRASSTGSTQRGSTTVTPMPWAARRSATSRPSGDHGADRDDAARPRRRCRRSTSTPPSAVDRRHVGRAAAPWGSAPRSARRRRRGPRAAPRAGWRRPAGAAIRMPGTTPQQRQVPHAVVARRRRRP